MSTRKTENDFQPAICAECGAESGPLYIDTDDGEVLCLDCLMALPSQEAVDLNEANEKAINLTAEISRDGRGITVTCPYCDAEIASFHFSDGEAGAYALATALLEADEEHICEPEADNAETD